jgi:hypothetical protein
MNKGAKSLLYFFNRHSCRELHNFAGICMNMIIGAHNESII